MNHADQEKIDVTNPLSHEAQAAKRFMGLSLGQALIIVTQVIGIVWIAAGIKSDVRDNSTRLAQHDRDIDELKKDQARDREESSKILRELNTKASDLNASVQILLDRTAPKHP